ncbi:hypothetical protein KY285_007413 [Solanum tuberosum]|nr:hypothetical protein KY285_007413 [Solanum tuberosum]
MGEEYGIQPSAEHYASVVDMLGELDSWMKLIIFLNSWVLRVMSWEDGDHSLQPAECIEILNWGKLFPFINDQLPLKLEISQEYPFYLFGGKRGVPDRKRRVLSKMTTSIKLSD